MLIFVGEGDAVPRTHLSGQLELEDIATVRTATFNRRVLLVHPGGRVADPAVFALYVGTAAAVSTLVALRILMAGNDRPERTPAPPAPRRPLPAPDPGTTSDTDPTLELPAVPRSV